MSKFCPVRRNSLRALFFIFSLGVSNTFAGSTGEVQSDFNFNGFYAGLGTGFTEIVASTSYVNNYSQYGGYFDTSNHATYNNTAILFTGQIGYGKMFREKTYLGAKGSIYYTPFKLVNPRRGGNAKLLIPITDTKLDSSYSSQTSIAPIYNLDIMLGYEILSNLLPFVQGGVTFSNVHEKFFSSRAFTNSATGQSINYQHTLDLGSYVTGYNVGIGANYLVRKNCFFFSELVYNDLGGKSKAVSVSVPFNGGLSEVYSRTENTHMISLFAGVSYLFPA